MDNDEYIGYLEDKESVLNNKIKKLFEEIDYLGDENSKYKEELEKAKETIEELTEILDALEQEILSNIKIVAKNVGYHDHMEANLNVISDDESNIGYYERSIMEIASHYDNATSQGLILEALIDLYYFLGDSYKEMYQHRKEGINKAKEEIGKMKNSSDPYLRKLVGGK
jgi:chromosome segregation ATPase